MKKQEKLKQLEELENKYLLKYYHFLKFAEDELLLGFKTKDKIKSDWYSKWLPIDGEKGISDFSTGAERIVYSLLNGKGIGQPNSAPIGSDLFFEVEDAFIHIDLKTVQTRNIGDYTGDIFVGNNQNSYNGEVVVSNTKRIYDNAHLPTFYTIDNKTKKPCLTYFITILYEELNLEILNINIVSMPNGDLYPIYGSDILKQGKVKFDKKDPKHNTHARSIRFNWKNAQNFKLLGKNIQRIKVAYFNNNMDDKFRNKLQLIENLL